MFNISFKRVGGLWFWNIGRIGGSFHVSSRTSYAHKQYVNAHKRTLQSYATVLSINIGE